MRLVHVGNVLIGGGNPVSVQTMYDCPIPHASGEIDALMRRMGTLHTMGCDIIRYSYPHLEDHDSFKEICRRSPMPVVADIHFDWKCALDAIACGAHAIRINPGNIGARWKVDEVFAAAKDHDIAIRIGLNKGSLPRTGNPDPAQRMVDYALEYLDWAEQAGFTNCVVSLKSSDVKSTVAAYRLMAERTDYPLHVGVTEAGTARMGLIKSAAGIGALLADGIGDTIRVSLTAPPVEEIYAGADILKALGLGKPGVNLVSCPTCGRTKIDLIGLASRVEAALRGCSKPITVAVMGCIVNGPGEAREADIGIAGGDGEGLLFKKGEIVRKVKEEELFSALMEEIASM